VAFTGSTTGPMTLIGLASILLGIILLVGSRRGDALATA
jgi:hypothetical protein